jgi:CPA1 family monovalent cation:H+ antiporter
MVGVAAERAALLTLLRSRKIGSEVGRKLTRELDLSEARLRT